MYYDWFFFEDVSDSIIDISKKDENLCRVNEERKLMLCKYLCFIFIFNILDEILYKYGN